MTPLGLIFDIDGTLVTFRFDVRGTRSALMAEISKMGLSTANLSLSSPTQGIIDEVRAQIGGKSEFASARRRLYDILDEFEVQSSRDAELLPGALETLRSLQERSVKMCILTNGGRLPATRLLERHSLAGFFDFVLTRDDVDAMKPAPDGIHRAVSLLSLPTEQVNYVGDSLLDIAAARKAGMRVISVATGNYGRERLASEGADVVIDSLGQLLDVLPPYT